MARVIPMRGPLTTRRASGPGLDDEGPGREVGAILAPGDPEGAGEIARAARQAR